MYVLLSGRPPFEGDNDKEICKKVKTGKYSMSSAIWKTVSNEAIDLVKRLLQYNPDKRLACKDALEHTWFTYNLNVDNDTTHTLEALHNLRDFRAEKKLQQAAMTFIVSQLASKEEMDQLQEAFKSLDITKTGVITKDELLLGYKVMMDAEMAEAEVDRIMEIADTNKSGEIDYSEWVIATINKSKMLSDDNMRQAFELFDKDGNGLISSSEIKTVLGIGKKFDEKIWEEVVFEADIDGDGQISYEEFKTMMENLLREDQISKPKKLLTKSVTLEKSDTKNGDEWNVEND